MSSSHKLQRTFTFFSHSPTCQQIKSISDNFYASMLLLFYNHAVDNIATCLHKRRHLNDEQNSLNYSRLSTLHPISISMHSTLCLSTSIAPFMSPLLFTHSKSSSYTRPHNPSAHESVAKLSQLLECLGYCQVQRREGLHNTRRRLLLLLLLFLLLLTC